MVRLELGADDISELFGELEAGIAEALAGSEGIAEGETREGGEQQ